jgi:UPF0755 protein
MIDELDLYFDDRGQRRHRRGARVPQQQGRAPRRKPKRGCSGFALFFSLILLGLLAGGGYFGYGKVKDYFGAKDYTGPGVGEVQVQVIRNDTATDIANRLYEKGVVKSAKAFVDAANANPKSKTIEVGYYKLRKQMKATLALGALLARNSDGTLANKVSTKVTITEGMITTEIYAKLAEVTKLPKDDFVNAAKDPIALGVPDWWFKRQDGKPQQTPPSIEGFLYPATYEFEPGADAKTILSQMVQQFLTVTGDMKFADTVQSAFNISPYEALIAASIAQVEAMFPEDMPGVARVIYNRAYSGKFACSCLGLDSAVNYWLRITGKEAKDSGSLTYAQIHDKNNPYNTHDLPGLPPSPISNPGKEALTGAMTAPKSGYLYFLAIDTAGHTAFATTYHEFCQKTHEAKANGVSISTCTA